MVTTFPAGQVTVAAPRSNVKSSLPKRPRRPRAGGTLALMSAKPACSRSSRVAAPA